MTAYNWETNDSNAGADYLNQNDTFSAAIRRTALWHRARGGAQRRAGMIVTVPIIGYVSADHNGGGDVVRQLTISAFASHQSPARKGSAFTLTPNTTDAFVYQDEYVNFLDKTYLGAFARVRRPDAEPR
jgi:hypothetical protein